METQSYPEEKEDISERPDGMPFPYMEYDEEELVGIQLSLGGSASKDPFMTAALAAAVGDQHAKDSAKCMWEKIQRKMKANVIEMQKRQEEGTENKRAERGKRGLENECS